MGIVYQYDKRYDVTYAYESTSYYDKTKKQSRSKRTLLGRVNPVTKQIEPTRKTKRSKSFENSSFKQSESTEQTPDQELSILRIQVEDMKKRLEAAEQKSRQEQQKRKTLILELQKVLARFDDN